MNTDLPPPMNHHALAQLDDYIGQMHYMTDRLQLKIHLLAIIECSIQQVGHQLTQNDMGILANVEYTMNRMDMTDNSRWIADVIITMVRQSTREQRIYIFNRIAALFRE